MFWQADNLTSGPLKPSFLMGTQSIPHWQGVIAYIPKGADAIIPADLRKPIKFSNPKNQIIIRGPRENIFIYPDFVLEVRPTKIDRDKEWVWRLERNYPWAFVNIN